jgi:ATP-dependent Clp protease ATP-binding subunit ClpA
MSRVEDIRPVLVRAARSEAVADGSSTIEAEHLLLALAGRHGTAAQRILGAAGLDRAAVVEALRREREQSLRAVGVTLSLNELPVPSPDRSARPRIASSVKQALLRGHQAAASRGGGRMSSSHLLAGVLGAKLGTVPRALHLAGVDRSALVASVESELDRPPAPSGD